MQGGRNPDHQFKLNKAFKHILGAPATQFEGSNKIEYKPWKEALHREVDGLDLSAHQWLDLLRVRTTGDAQAALKPSMIIQQELSAEDALDSAWKTLDQRYWTAQRPSQQLIANLLHGPTVIADDPIELSNFASSCETILFLKQRDPLSFASLDEHTTIQTILNRLDTPLYNRWY